MVQWCSGTVHTGKHTVVHTVVMQCTAGSGGVVQCTAGRCAFNALHWCNAKCAMVQWSSGAVVLCTAGGGAVVQCIAGNGAVHSGQWCCDAVVQCIVGSGAMVQWCSTQQAVVKGAVVQSNVQHWTVQVQQSSAGSPT